MQKRDKINILSLLTIGILSIILILGSNYIFGSDLDWRTQHYAIPEYFRTLFYSDFKLIPSFAFNLGGGQNIYNFSYYGLLSPIILISYLLPFVKMIYYIQTISIVLYLVSIALFYKWIRGRFDSNNAFFLSLIFMFAMPLLFHSHRHIMFVSYMPFLIMAYMGLDKIFKEKKSALFIISTFLLIMTNYFFAVSSLFSLALYAIYYQLENNYEFKKSFINIIKLAVPVIIIVLSTAVLLLPTAYTLLSGRADANVDTSLIKLLTPYFHGMYFMYTPYSLGLNSFMFLSIIMSFFKKGKHIKFLATLFILLNLFPIFIYILNGGMYINAKVLIPFIPLALILIGNTLDIFDNKKQLIISSIIYLIVMLLIPLTLAVQYRSYLYLDVISTLIILTIHLFTKKRELLYFALATLAFTIFLNINKTDELVTRTELDTLNKADSVNYKFNDVYRFGDITNDFDNLNRVQSTEIYKTTLYSSVSNGNYNNFFYNIFTNEVQYRNSAITSQSSNIMFNTYMGVKYIISDNELMNYKKEDNIYINENVLPIGYATSQVMGVNEFNKLKFPYTNEALINNVVISKETSNTYSTNIEKLNLNYKISKVQNLKLTKNEEKYTIKADDNAFFVIDLENTITDKIVFISFNMDYNEVCSVGDNVITINGVTNKLTCSSWKYHNRNYKFEYVLSTSNEIKNLVFELGKGKYKISNIEIYQLDNSKLITNKDISPLIINPSKTKGDQIVGNINVQNDGYFKMTVPYDKGFKAYLNGKEIEIEKVDNAFIGFAISKGEYEFKLIYEAPLLKESKYISFIGITSAIVYLFIERRKNNEKNIISNTML